VHEQRETQVSLRNLPFLWRSIDRFPSPRKGVTGRTLGSPCSFTVPNAVRRRARPTRTVFDLRGLRLRERYELFYRARCDGRIRYSMNGVDAIRLIAEKSLMRSYMRFSYIAFTIACCDVEIMNV
jgi:hypothetical protein